MAVQTWLDLTTLKAEALNFCKYQETVSIA